MPILRRVVFGEPAPAGVAFAALLSNLHESVSYCNRAGPRQHDRVTDVPFSIPVLGLTFDHPTELKFLAASSLPGDDWGIFKFHHIEIYSAAAAAAGLDPVHVECARLCRAIYAKPGDPQESWDERLDTSGIAWAVKFDGKRVYVVFRGLTNIPDWIRDVAGFAPAVPHATFGQVWGGFLVGMPETWAVIKPLIASADEVVFTGHSLGAAHADFAAGYALTNRPG